ncbi:MAG TPA: HAD-IA family hydrolase [Candidatus Binatia bacterium]|nr:HAD-IA family hydrolase [Candidatus Binatia bacterium]
MSLAAVTLDGAGTLFAVAEPVGGTYARLAARHGIRADPADVERRFRAAFVAAPPLAFPGTSPAQLAGHERAWWHAVVRQALGDADPAALDAAFDTLWAHFAAPEAWRVFPDVAPALAALRARGLRLAIVSNFDTRLLRLVDGLGLARLVDDVVPSTQAGAAKPDPAIFRAALARLGARPAAALHVGDHAAVDVAGARAAGMHAALLARGAEAGTPGVPRLASLAELPALVDALGSRTGQP